MTEANKEELRRLAEAFRKTKMNSAAGVELLKRWIDLASPEGVLSLLDESAVLHAQVKTLQSDENSWQSGYDKGREMGAKHRSAEAAKLRAENESLRAQLKACHPFRPAQDHVTAFSPGCLVCGQYADHGGLQCPKMRAECTAQEVKR